MLACPIQYNHNHHASGKQQTTITVVGIPSVTIQNDRLVVGSSQTSCTRSYTPVKVLGDGSFATVLLCDWHGTLPPNTPLSPMQCGAGARPDWAGMRLVAVKRIKKKWEGGWDECQKLQSLRAIPCHPNIIPLYDFFLFPDTKELYFVFESMEGNLRHLIKAHKGRPLAGGLVSHIFVQIVEGLHHIHTHDYFHRDMKPENVLVTTTGLFDYTSVSPIAPPNARKEKDVVAIIKLADFGLARETKSSPPYTEYICNRWYRAPEVLLFSRNYSNPVDMWALGTIMAELVNFEPLFPGSDQVDQVARICEVLGDPSDGLDAMGSIVGGGTWSKGEELAKSIGFQFPKIPPKDFYSLFAETVPRSLIHCIQNLLRYDPDKRLTSQQCRTHPYLLETLPRNRITDTQHPLSSPAQKNAGARKHVRWGLGVFPGEKFRKPPLPADETSPTAGRKSVRQPSPVREHPRSVAAAKKWAQRLHREAELEKRKMQEHNARQQARAVLLKRQQVSRNSDEDLEWSEAPNDIEEVREARRYQNRNANLRTITAAGKFVMSNVNELPPEHDRREREWRGPSALRRALIFDDDDDSSSDVHTITRMPSRSSLRTSFDDLPPSATASISYSYAGQLAHNFQTRACVPSNLPLLSPPPLQMPALSPTMSPLIPPRFHGSTGDPQSHVDTNGELRRVFPGPCNSPSPHTPSSGHKHKSAKSIVYPIFRASDNLVPDTSHHDEMSRQPLLPMDETSPTVAFQLRKRSQSDGTNSITTASLRRADDEQKRGSTITWGGRTRAAKNGPAPYSQSGSSRNAEMLRKDVGANEIVGDYQMTRSNVISEEDYDESDACSLLSVLPVDAPSRSSIGARSDDSSDTVYWSLNPYNMSETSIVTFGDESDRGSFTSCMVDGSWDKRFVISRETFETAQEPPPELLLALGLYLDPISPTLPTSDEVSLTDSSADFKDESRNEGPSRKEEPLLLGNPTTNSKNQIPLYNTAFIRDVSNVCISGSQINFTTNIVHHDDSVRVGLHTLYLRSDPTGLRNSYERQKRVNQQMKAIRAWGSQLLITSSSTPGTYALSVPSIKTRDLEEVVKEVFTWIYSASSPQSIMWLHDEEYEGNSRTSLIGQCLADFLGERRDLTASYFYTKRNPVFSAGTSRSGSDDPSSIIPTIAYELTRRIPEIEIPIALTAANDHWIFDLSLDEQMNKLIVDPLLAASNIRNENFHKFPQLFLIHGLEDCDDDDFQELFLRGFGKSLTLLQQRIPQKLLLLGRQTACLGRYFSKPDIQEMVRQLPLPVSRDDTV